ncbi:ATP-dependent RecD-like DNA helicase [Paramagnetospirillum kuznetsovii]|uniref:ATP-dependent RecD-like DNA helicase n=2 Tax=Paramagnetospirillum kuznetsovii TaxID=2053833 RepID=A0A364NUN0_9PROT|nr:ATP-dependent RecD-like DNA helicase [Paramagnetospirillum kuznetsovii]RAU20784.1 ATP-dependent RecD-like DNA helicase [Paramagnetospirillum kuznetsovii]
MRPASTEDKEALVGLVERVTFHSPDTGFCVLRIKARGQRDLVTVTGSAATIQPGEYIHASGRWDNHRDHGLQFKATFMKVTPPTSLDGIERYLGSGMIKGIGPVYGKKLVKAFGEAVFDVIEQTPEKLQQVDGIGPVRAKRIAAGWAEQKAIREIMLFLQSHGVSTARAVRIYKTYGTDAVPLVSENPYRLARDIRGIGFRTADQIAEKLGIEKTSMIRARAGLSYALMEAVGDGHCALPEDKLLILAEELLEIPQALLTDALALELKEANVTADTVGDRRCIFLPHLWHAEQAIASRLRALATGTAPWPSIDAEKAIPWVEAKLGVTLADSQRAAVGVALASKVMVITGGPGVGKTTLVNSILRILAAKGGTVALAAPTGRAAKRLSESTGMEAKTIHRLLEFDPSNGGFKRSEEMPLECDLLVVDETSMVDVPLMASLLKSVPGHAAVMIVGDVDQLPSVGPGQVLADIINSGIVPVAKLTEIFRQAASSKIIINAHKVNKGQMPELVPPPDGVTDFYFVEAAEPEDAVPKIIEVVSNRVPRRFGMDAVRDIQVLCPMQRGGVGARSLNVELQKALNPGRHGEPSVERFGYLATNKGVPTCCRNDGPSRRSKVRKAIIIKVSRYAVRADRQASTMTILGGRPDVPAGRDQLFKL